ncbi:low-complexity tail membrane protein [Pannus brasiliensis CCIBt3594]|uniref:Low-complexity tail membrane protein n=1 Tax=Pannus brasiliensis CCIBt3594 TaxID=1427578 RepID=A0AAW9QQ61_9CHRO
MKSEPFLWIHLAGIAAFPLFLQIAWVGLAIGDPLPFFWPEWIFLIAIAVVPITWMQWARPFDIFSLLIVALKPDRLTPEQLKILSLFKRPRHRAITILGTVLFLAIVWQVYRYAPLAASVAGYFPQWRLLGLSIAAIALLLAHLFLQVPLSVLAVLVTNDRTWTEIEPVTVDRILQLFTLFGLKVNKILPPIEAN